MLNAIIWLTVITLIPALELRASIPCGILPVPIPFTGITVNEHLSWPVVVLVCTAVNILLGWVVFGVLGPVFTFVRKWEWFDRGIWPKLERTRHRIHPYIEKYGELGVALFIGIPLPGSGVYTGAFGAYLLGVGKKKFAVANVIGVLLAAAAVTAVCLLVLYGTVGEESWLAKWFLSRTEEIESAM
ncbi:MAG: small multi-drug export protein [Kiritimatiellia bacterium]